MTERDTGVEPARVVLVDDSTLFRSGVARLLELAGICVVGQLSSAAALPALIHESNPDVVILDVRLPPTYTDEGIKTAVEVRAAHKSVGILVMSTYAEGGWARRLLADGGRGIGYLMKDRVDDVATLIDAIERVSGGGMVVDAEVVSRLVELTSRRSVLEALSMREREVLTLMAQGLSNAAIGRALFLSPKTVEAHIASLFSKLPLADDGSNSNRRVLAVLTFLQHRSVAG